MTAQQAGPADVAAIATALEQVFFAAVGVTAVALGQARVSEDLTIVQWRALVLLRARDGVRVGQLASGLGMSLPSASRLATRMERRGFVTTARAHDDRRGTVVTITDVGETIRQTVIASRQELLREALARHADAFPPGTERVLNAVADALTRYR